MIDAIVATGTGFPAGSPRRCSAVVWAVVDIVRSFEDRGARVEAQRLKSIASR